MNIMFSYRVFFFCLFLTFLASNIFSVPYIDLNENTITSSSLHLTGSVSKGVNLYLLVGGSQIRNKIFSGTNLNIDVSSSLSNLNIEVGSEIYIKNTKF